MSTHALLLSYILFTKQVLMWPLKPVCLLLIIYSNFYYPKIPIVQYRGPDLVLRCNAYKKNPLLIFKRIKTNSSKKYKDIYLVHLIRYCDIYNNSLISWTTSRLSQKKQRWSYQDWQRLYQTIDVLQLQ